MMIEQRPSSNRWAWIIMALYLICAITYSLVTPAWEAPDEVGHFDFIRHLRQTKTLPDVRTAVPGEAHQPPLYYLVATFFTLPANTSSPVGAFRVNPDFMWRNTGGTDINAGLRGTAQTFPYQGQGLALQLARLASVAMGALTVWLIIKTGWLVFPNQPQIGLLAGTLAAFTPQFLFISGAVNNDNMLILATTGACWQMVKALKQPQRWQQWAFVGLWLAAAVLSKLTGAAVGITAVFALLLCAITAHSWALLLRGGAGLAVPPLLLSGWWFVRNQLLYGDLLGLRIYEQIFAVNVRQTALKWSDLREFARVQFHSFWGVFGWMNVAAPDWFYTAVRVLLLAALLGGLLFVIRKQHTSLSRWQKQALAVLGVALLAQEGIILYTLLRCNASCYQGRYLLPVLVSIMLFISLGLFQLVPQHRHTNVTVALFPVLVGVALFIALGVIRPAYTMKPLPGWQLWTIPNQTAVEFAPFLQLRGHEIHQEDETLAVTLYWRLKQSADFDYSVFVHVLDPTGELVTQQDQPIGHAINRPLTDWAVADLVADTYLLQLPNSRDISVYQIQVGVYNWISGNRLPLYYEETPQGDFLVLDEVSLP